MSKKCLAISLFTLVFTFSLSAHALNLGDEFKNMGSDLGGVGQVSDATSFKTATQSGVHLGGVSIRYPVKTLNLVSIERASFNAGCHGIDINFGGMAFIKADEIVDMLKQIANGVPMMFYQMALKAIAAPVMDAINKIYDTMQKLSQALKNSCQASEALATSLVGLTADEDGKTWMDKSLGAAGAKIDKWSEDAGKEVNKGLKDAMNATKKGLGSMVGESDKAKCMIEALSLGIISDPSSKKVCGGDKAPRKVDDTKRMIETLAAKPGWDMDKAKMFYAGKYGNSTWNALQAIGVAPSTKDTETSGSPFSSNMMFAVLLQSVVGTTMYYTTPNITKENEDQQNGQLIPGRLPTDVLFYIFMCGDKEGYLAGRSAAVAAGVSATNIDLIESFCKKHLFKTEVATDPSWNLPVIGCDDANNKEWMGACLIPNKGMSLGTASTLYGSVGQGFFWSVTISLSSAVSKAAKGTEDFTPQEKAIIAMAPFPLYKAINVASANPYLANQLIQANSVILAVGFTGTFLQNSFSAILRSKGVDTGRIPNLPMELTQTISTIQSELINTIDGQGGLVNEYTKAGERIMFHVNNIDREILKSSMALGISGTEFAEAMVTMTSQ